MNARHDPFERREFDAVLAEFFPNSVRSREEHRRGWTDTLDVTLLQIRVTAWAMPQGMAKAGDVFVELRGVRTSVDGTSATLWARKAHGLSGMRECLDDLRRRLLGVAAALLHMSGNIPEIPRPASGPVRPPRKGDPVDLDSLFR